MLSLLFLPKKSFGVCDGTLINGTCIYEAYCRLNTNGVYNCDQSDSCRYVNRACSTNGTSCVSTARDIQSCRIVWDPVRGEEICSIIHSYSTGQADCSSGSGPPPPPPSGGSCSTDNTNYGQSSSCSNAGGTCQNTCQDSCSGSYQTGLCPGPSYWVCCVGSCSNPGTPSITAPGAYPPTILNSGTNRFDWNGVSGATSYRWRVNKWSNYNTDNGLDCGSGGDTCGSTSSTYRDVSMVDNITYTLSVRAQNSCGNSSYRSRIVRVCNSPGAPTITSTYPTNNSTMNPGTYPITWTDTTAPIADFYLFIVDQDSNLTVPSNIDSCADVSLGAGDSCVQTTGTSASATFATGHTSRIYIAGVRNCGRSATASITGLTVQYPQVIVGGNLREYANNACYTNIKPSSGPTFSGTYTGTGGPLSGTPVCTTTAGPNGSLATYRCTYTFNTSSNTNTVGNLTLTALSGAPYTTGRGVTGGTCSLTENPVAISLQPGQIQDLTATSPRDMIFSLGGPWAKIKNTTFVNNDPSGFSNPIPFNITAFDNSVDISQDITTRPVYFDIQGSGFVSGPVTTAGNNISFGSADDVSVSTWKAPNAPNIGGGIAKFIDYIKARKNLNTITDVNNVASNKINYMKPPTGSIDINRSDVALSGPQNAILVIDGDANITAQQIKISNAQSFALVVSGTLTFTGSSQSAEGIYAAKTIVVRNASGSGLKIVGNLIADNFSNERQQSDNSKPSLYVVFDPKYNMNLLGLFSTSFYDWKQLQ